MKEFMTGETILVNFGNCKAIHPEYPHVSCIRDESCDGSRHIGLNKKDDGKTEVLLWGSEVKEGESPFVFKNNMKVGSSTITIINYDAR